MSFLDLPAEVITKIGDGLHHIDDGERVDITNYELVVRFCMSSKVINQAVQGETDRRIKTTFPDLKKAELEYALGLPPRRASSYLLPSYTCLLRYKREIHLGCIRMVYRNHLAKITYRGGDQHTSYHLGWSLVRQATKQYGRLYHRNFDRHPASASILVLRLHPSDQEDVNVRSPRFGTLVNGMECYGDTYLVLPHDYAFTAEQKGYIHALFGRYFTTTIAELKDALAKDDAEGGVKALEEYNNTPVQGLLVIPPEEVVAH